MKKGFVITKPLTIVCKFRMIFGIAGFHFCGEGGIRTLGTLASTPAFQAGSFDHSDTSPEGYKSIKKSEILHFNSNS
jgi:hypothetical protein